MLAKACQSHGEARETRIIVVQRRDSVTTHSISCTWRSLHYPVITGSDRRRLLL